MYSPRYENVNYIFVFSGNLILKCNIYMEEQTHRNNEEYLVTKINEPISPPRNKTLSVPRNSVDISPQISLYFERNHLSYI